VRCPLSYEIIGPMFSFARPSIDGGQSTVIESNWPRR